MKKQWVIFGFVLVFIKYSEAGENIEPDSSKYINLVYNGSFEDYRHCPKRVDAIGILSLVDGWYQPTRGSADYFNVCGSRECGVPINKLGQQMPHEGNGYCGIYCSKNDYREYLQTKLRRKLQKGDSIRLTYWVSLSEESTGSIATLGGLFTKESISDTTRTIFLKKEHIHITEDISQTIAQPYIPQVVNNIDTPLTNTKDWQCITGIFVAHGGEQYITLGNFNTAESSGYKDLDSLSRLLPGSYYYIDDVTVTCLNCKPPVADDLNVDSTYLTEEQPAFTVGSTFVLKDIFFEFDKSTILQQSYFELMKLITLLDTYPKMAIEIRGHTDGKGADSYNQRLSENRAKAVSDYLTSKGISEKRLQYKGYGKTLPIDTNDTEEGRANNRRVEFKILDI